jgi:D-amino-acid oxidase
VRSGANLSIDGHAGYGYQAGYGSALEAERLVKEILKDKAKL